MNRAPLIYAAENGKVVRLLNGAPIGMSLKSARDLLAAHKRLNRAGNSPAAALIPQLEAAISEAEQPQHGEPA